MAASPVPPNFNSHLTQSNLLTASGSVLQRAVRRAGTHKVLDTPVDLSNFAVLPKSKWLADDASMLCGSCLHDFNAVTRKHHCRGCGKIFCGKCVPRRSIHIQHPSPANANANASVSSAASASASSTTTSSTTSTVSEPSGANGSPTKQRGAVAVAAEAGGHLRICQACLGKERDRAEAKSSPAPAPASPHPHSPSTVSSTSSGSNSTFSGVHPQLAAPSSPRHAAAMLAGSSSLGAVRSVSPSASLSSATSAAASAASSYNSGSGSHSHSPTTTTHHTTSSHHHHAVHSPSTSSSGSPVSPASPSLSASGSGSSGSTSPHHASSLSMLPALPSQMKQAGASSLKEKRHDKHVDVGGPVVVVTPASLTMASTDSDTTTSPLEVEELDLHELEAAIAADTAAYPEEDDEKQSLAVPGSGAAGGDGAEPLDRSTFITWRGDVEGGDDDDEASAGGKGKDGKAKAEAKKTQKKIKDMQGYLFKKSPNPLGMGMYQKRYVCLRDGKMSYWATEEQFKAGQSHKGVIDLAKIFRTKITGEVNLRNLPKFMQQVKDGCQFEMHKPPKRVYHWSASTPEEAASWVEAIFSHSAEKTRDKSLLTLNRIVRSVTMLKNVKQTMENSLKSVPYLSGLEPTKIRVLCSLFSFVELREEEYLYREGAYDREGQSLFFVYLGQVRVLGTDKNSGQEKEYTVLGKGKVFGEVGCMLDLPRTASIQAVYQTTLLQIRKAHFASFVKLAPEILKKFAANLNQYNIELRHIVNSKPLLRAFRQHCVTEHSDENIDFVIEAIDFATDATAMEAKQREAPVQGTVGRSRRGGNVELEAKAKVIEDKYIGERAPSQINISADTMRRLKELFDSGKVDRTIFEEAKEEILSLMSGDTFRRFQATELFRKCLDDLVLSAAAAAPPITTPDTPAPITLPSAMPVTVPKTARLPEPRPATVNSPHKLSMLLGPGMSQHMIKHHGNAPNRSAQTVRAASPGPPRSNPPLSSMFVAPDSAEAGSGGGNGNGAAPTAAQHRTRGRSHSAQYDAVPVKSQTQAQTQTSQLQAHSPSPSISFSAKAKR